jgi:ubiquitin-protein ligase
MLNWGKRLRKEVDSLRSNPDPLICLSVKDDNIREWDAEIKGPDGSPYEGYSFRLSINISSDYPLTPPAIKFVTKCFHPNIKYDVRFIDCAQH